MRPRRGSRTAALAGVALIGLVAVALVALAPAPGAAQEDFRAADLDRPIKVEDALPVKLGEWEVELGTRAALREEGSGILGLLELKAGLFLNTQVGIEAETALEDEGGDGSRGGIEGFGGHVLYDFNRETRAWPAFAARIDVKTPGLGEIGREAWAVGLKGIATRSFDRLRLHANGGYVAAADEDGGDYWKAGLAFDYPLGLFSRALLGDLYAEIPAHEGRSRVWLELGMRWQIGNDEVFDFGVASRLDEWEAGNANVELVIGISHIFGVAGLVRVPSYPSPMIH